MSFSLSISAQQYQTYYAGQARNVVVTADNGKRLKFPASILQKLVTHEGIHGRFRIEFDKQHKFKQIIRL